MKHAIVLAVLCSPFLFAGAAEAKGPPAASRKVQCAKGWPWYMKANKLQDVEGARETYQAKCVAQTYC